MIKDLLTKQHGDLVSFLLNALMFMASEESHQKRKLQCQRCRCTERVRMTVNSQIDRTNMWVLSRDTSPAKISYGRQVKASVSMAHLTMYRVSAHHVLWRSTTQRRIYLILLRMFITSSFSIYRTLPSSGAVWNRAGENKNVERRIISSCNLRRFWDPVIE